MPAFVWRELEAFVDCGDPRRGFAWLVCDGCRVHRLVPFSSSAEGRQAVALAAELAGAP